MISVDIGCLLPQSKQSHAANLGRKKKTERKKKEKEGGNKCIMIQIFRQSGFYVAAYVETTV